MPNKDFQRHTFLGGEVSPSLYERADMDHFSKWFSKAENIRFFETGGFRNRPGFVKVADTKYNQAGDIIKLLSFSFNDEESFLVELGSSYIRFYKDGSPVMVNNEVYELKSPLSGFDDVDIKYAQSGDILFIVHPNFGIYQLSRINRDGTSWRLDKFQADVLPLKEANENKGIMISATEYEQEQKFVDISNTITHIYKNVSFSFDNDVIYTAETVSKEELLDGINNALNDEYEDQYNVSIRNDKLYIVNNEFGESVPDFSITFTTNKIEPYSISAEGWSKNTISLSYSNFYSLDSVYVKHRTSIGGAQDIFDGTKNISSDNINKSLDAIVGFGKVHWSSSGILLLSDGCQVNRENNTVSIYLHNETISTSALSVLRLSGYKEVQSTNTYNSESDADYASYYSLEATTGDVFTLLDVGETIGIKHYQNSTSISESISSSGTTTYGPVKSNGKWRLYTLGNWVGDITLQYSTDNGYTWVDFYNWESRDANDTPANINTSGTIESNGIVLFKVKAFVSSIGTKPLQLNFYTSDYSVNSYYQIISKTSNTEVITECIKNDVGEFSDNYNWRLPAFSGAEGWPQTIGFYQNRLFFGKDYILYGSKSNDFWDFYEPIELGDSDPVTMSLLSTKVNNIKNIVTQRSFFTFTGGGEFGIGSEGALTQADKHLKPFSSNGSAQCNPVLISDVVLFVDKSYNSVRALKYSLESDGYEAPDITLTLKYLLRNEKIISTDIIYEEKEALFLSDTGIVWVLKYIPDQNVLSWSHLKHAFGKITNICVVPNGAKNDLYIAVENAGRKWIEKLQEGNFLDTLENFQATTATKVPVSGGALGQKRVICQDGKYHTVSVDSNGEIDITDFNGNPFSVGAAYTTIATLLSPSINYDEYSKTTYHKKNPYKVWFYYTDSYGFKVGVEEDEKMAIEWQDAGSDIDDETNLTSGKKSVLIPSSFSHSGRVTFVQDKPYPMEIQDVLIETDIGGK